MSQLKNIFIAVCLVAVVTTTITAGRQQLSTTPAHLNAPMPQGTPVTLTEVLVVNKSVEPVPVNVTNFPPGSVTTSSIFAVGQYTSISSTVDGPASKCYILEIKENWIRCGNPTNPNRALIKKIFAGGGTIVTWVNTAMIAKAWPT